MGKIMVSEMPGRRRQLIIIFWFIAILFGIIVTLDGRHNMSGDGICYLDIGDAYFHRDLNAAINAYWSPFYSWILGMVVTLLKPSLYYEFFVVNVVNFVIYLCALVCFHFFLKGLCRYHNYLGINASKEGDIILPEWLLIILGYTLFIWSSLFLINIVEVTPDICVAAFVYLISGMLLRIRMGGANWGMFFILGIILGLGYLTKAFMFSMAFISLVSILFLIDNFKKAIPRFFGALIIFLLVISPFIMAISKVKGHLTIGDTGKLNYLWNVNSLPQPIPLEGNSPSLGELKHPPRKLSLTPEIYEFATPIKGTYPLIYNPSYWYEGVKFNFNLENQINTFKKNVKKLVGGEIEVGVLIYAILIFYFMSPRRWVYMKETIKYWFLLIPAILVLTMFSMVLIKSRYIAPFITLLWIGIFSGVRLPDSPESRKLIMIITISSSLLIMISVCDSIIPKACSVARYLLRGEIQGRYQMVDGLKQIGVRPGDKVAHIGYSFDIYWARLARVRIIAEMPYHKHGINSWEVDQLLNPQVINAFAGTEAKVIVMNIRPQNYKPPVTILERLGNTDYYAYILKR